jgi:hypothetical protein
VGRYSGTSTTRLMSGRGKWVMHARECAPKRTLRSRSIRDGLLGRAVAMDRDRGVRCRSLPTATREVERTMIVQTQISAGAAARFEQSSV